MNESAHITLQEYFSRNEHVKIIQYGKENGIKPQTDPEASRIIAASLFCMNRFEESVDWCSDISPVYEKDPKFAALYGAALRRNGEIDKAKSILEAAYKRDPNDFSLANNYANLLIDLGDLDVAKQILVELLASEPPNRIDVEANMQRIEYLRNLSSKDYNSDALKSDNFGHPDLDPLLRAFNEEEVSYARKRHLKNKDNVNSSENTLEDSTLNQKINELLSLAEPLATLDPTRCLSDLSNIYRICKRPIPRMYIIASEAHIQNKSFAEAERYLYIAYVIGARNKSLFVNLANLAAMRADWTLVDYYSERLVEEGLFDAEVKSCFDKLATNRKNADRTSMQFKKCPPDQEGELSLDNSL